MIVAHYKELLIPDIIKSPNWEKALAWLKADSWKGIPMEDRFAIDGSNVSVRRSSTMTKPESEAQYETHRIYADIQMPIKGMELHMFCSKDGLKIADPYSEEKDVEFYEGNPAFDNRIILCFPMAAIFFPWDAHKTTLSVTGSATEIEKLYFKVRM